MAEYHIEFNTKEMPGRILATRVRLDKDVMRDLDKKVNVGLAADPLYPVLERYVLANPSRRVKR